MAGTTTKPPYLKFLFFISLITAAFQIQGVAGSRTTLALSYQGKKVHQTPSANQEIYLQNSGEGRINKNSKRLMIGSVAPTCTYNECRGCKYKCRAEQVPVEGNDPINSAYHYKCVCHR